MGHNFRLLDYVILLLTLVISFAIGLYYAVVKRNRTTSQYLMADRKLKVAPVSVSLVVSYTSTVSLYGNAAELYYYGINFMFFLFGYVLSALVSAYVFVPVIYPLKLTSISQVDWIATCTRNRYIL